MSQPSLGSSTSVLPREPSLSCSGDAVPELRLHADWLLLLALPGPREVSVGFAGFAAALISRRRQVAVATALMATACTSVGDGATGWACNRATRSNEDGRLKVTRADVCGVGEEPSRKEEKN